jgi:hypothetical protein
MGDEGKAVGIAQAPAALLFAFPRHENALERDHAGHTLFIAPQSKIRPEIPL